MRMNRLLTRILLIATPLFMLSACTVFPGSNLTRQGKDVVGQQHEDIASKVKIIPMVSSVVADLKSPALQPQNNEQLDAQLASYEYRIGVADVINVTIWDHPELTIPAGSYRSAADSGNWVHADGTIFYPYIGNVHVLGKTVSEVRSIVSKRLEKYIENPQVDVSISAFRSQKMFVTGEVQSPGVQAITNVPLTLLSAINQAHGLGAEADWRNVALTRAGEELKISLYGLIQKGDLTQNQLLMDGDIVHVPRNDDLKVFVMGEVEKPSMLKMGRNIMSLTEALAAAGGIKNNRADASGVYVIRATHQQDILANIYQLNMADASALVLGSEFELHPRDVVYVSAAPIVVWNRLMDQLLPTIVGVSGATRGLLDLKAL